MDTVYNLSNAAETPISSTADSFIIPPPLPESDEKKTRGESEDGTFDLLVSDWRRLISSGAGFIDSIIEAAKIVICRKHGNFEMLQIHSNPILNVEDSQRLLLSSHPPSTQFAAGATLLVLALLISMRF
jgi:hypothetical protein